MYLRLSQLFYIDAPHQILHRKKSMSKIPLIKTILLGIAITLLAPFAARATTTTWDPNNWIPGNLNGCNWSLSNGNLTATSPNTGTTWTGGNGTINGAYGTTAIPQNAK